MIIKIIINFYDLIINYLNYFKSIFIIDVTRDNSSFNIIIIIIIININKNNFDLDFIINLKINYF